MNPIDDAIRRTNPRLGIKQCEARDALLIIVASLLAQIPETPNSLADVLRTFMESLGVPVPAFNGAKSDEAWQPIESAPTDGTKIDLWVTAWFSRTNDGQSQRVPDCYWAGRDDPCGTDWTGWTYDDATAARAYPVESDETKATHWIPIPEGPRQ